METGSGMGTAEMSYRKQQCAAGALRCIFLEAPCQKTSQPWPYP
jgi:hypothetical protein